MEYSANLDSDLDIPLLFEKINKTAIGTGVFPIGGIRTRAVRCEYYRIGEGDPENTFVYLTVKVGAGRDLDILKDAGNKIFKILTEYLQPIFDNRYMSIGMDIQELHPELGFKQNNIHKKLEKTKRP